MNYAEKARELRNAKDTHYNCAQAVIIPFAKEMKLTEEQARALGAHFGAGMRHGATCGTVTGALMVLGMTNCPPEQADALRRMFLENYGEINCAALLKKSHDAGVPRKEHCDGLVFQAVELLD